MAHIYDESAAKSLVQKILESYIPAFQLLRDNVRAKYSNVLEEL